VTSLIINIINPFPRPYFCDYNDVELEGKSKVLELTTNFHLFQRSALSALFQFPLLMRRIKMAKCDLFLVAFFHIHELTVPGTGPNELTKLDQSSIIKVRKMLKSLQCIENVQFVTLSEARKILTS
jgi:hypothetical protein